MTRIALQIANFTFPGVGPDGLFDAVKAQAQTAERSGYDTVLVMDHFYQLPHLGEPQDYMVEAYSLLSALAPVTETVRLGTLVTGNTYRNPPLLAKCVTALDVVSKGRAQLGIGAGWFEIEHDSYGYEFGTFTDRFEKLEESLQIILPMLRDDRPSLAGKHYTVRDAINQPPPVGRIPVMIGGSGEQKTLRMVAQYADMANITSPLEEFPRKLAALDEHCARVGRDRSEVHVTKHVQVVIGPTHDEAMADAKAFLLTRGIDFDAADEDTQRLLLSLAHVGDSDEIGEYLEACKVAGADGVTLGLPANGWHLERIEQLGEVAGRVFGNL